MSAEAGAPAAPTPEIAAVLLAAGLSRRMGEVNKLLLPVRGEPMVRVCARALLASKVTSITVVLGHDADSVAAALEGLCLRVVRNPDYGRGQTTSIRAGLAAAPEVDGYLMALADQPHLTAENIDHILNTYKTLGRVALVPTFQGRRGNPVIMPARSRAVIAQRPEEYGCREFMADHPEDVRFIDCGTSNVANDVDTPEAYAKL